MRESESERRRRFDALFSAYGSDVVAYCGWRAGSASDAPDAVADVCRRRERAGARDLGGVDEFSVARDDSDLMKEDRDHV